jgi:ParB family chromosome partitioning protein
LLELSASIQQNGLIQPITVRRVGDHYELVSGERRLKACVFAGLKTVPCILINASDRESSLMCLIENIQRTDLNFFEEADGIKKLMSDFSLSQQEVSAKLGVAQSTLSNKLRLLKLTREQREKILSAKLKERHARAIIRLPENLRDEALNRIIAEQLSLSETEELIEKMLQPHGESVKPLRLGKIGDIRIFSNSISRIIGTMRRSGLDAKSRKNETDSYIEYTIIIPKERDVTH